MTLNPISIATSGVYASNINLGLASFGYIDLAVVLDIEPASSGGGSMWGREEVKRNDDDRVIMAVINKFLDEINR